MSLVPAAIISNSLDFVCIWVSLIVKKSYLNEENYLKRKNNETNLSVFITQSFTETCGAGGGGAPGSRC